MRYNNTTNIPDKLIAIAVGFSIAPGVEIECVTVKNKKAGIVGGQWGWYFPSRREVVVIVPRVLEGSTFKLRGTGAIVSYTSRTEFLVGTLAHELRHAWQFQCAGWSSEMLADYRTGEIDAESFQVRQINKWRDLMDGHMKAASEGRAE